MKSLIKKFVFVLMVVLTVFAVTACDKIIEQPGLSDEEIVVNVLNNVKINYAEGETDVTISKDLQLPTVSTDGCTITWKSNDEAVISNEGKVIQADVDKQVKLTVKVTLNDTELEKSFNVTVLKKSTDVEPEIQTSSIAEILALAIEEGTQTENTYKVKGTITEIQNALFGNVVISDGTNTLLVYGIFDANGNRFDALENKPAVGDTIVVEGPVKKFSGVNEISNSTLLQLTKGTNPVVPPVDQDVKTIAEILALNVEENTTTTEKYTAKGVITEVQNTMYGNVVIEDSTGSILVYGIYDETGTIRYDALDYKPVVGDTITVTGVVKNYKGTLELVNAWLLKVEKAGDTPDTPIGEDEVKATIAEVLALNIADNASTEKKYVVTGTITEIKNASFGNVMISDGTNELLVYGIYDANGVRYDAFSYQPKVGDTITVSGVVMNISGTKEIYNSVLVKCVQGDDPDVPPVVIDVIDITIADLLKLEVAANATTNDYYRVTGKVTLVQNETRGDVYITDGTNSLLIYGIFDEEGLGYSEMENKPTPGDTITVVGVVKNYNSTNEILSGTLEELVEGEPEELKTSTIADVAKVASGSLVKVEGVVIAVNAKEFLVKDATGAILVYMNYTSFSYVVGDKLTIVGAVTTYNGKNQFDNKATITKTGTETYTDPEALELDRDKFEDAFERNNVGDFVELTGKLIADGAYYNMEVEGSTKIAAILYPQASLSLGLYTDKQIKVKAYTIGINSDGDRLNLLVVSAECLEEVGGDKLPQTYSFVTASSGSTDLAKGWSWTKVNSKGSYTYENYQSFRNDGEGVQSPILEASNKIKVTINYFLNNLGSTKNKVCYIKVTAYKADGTLVASQTSANLNTKADVEKQKLVGTHDLEFVLEGEDIAYITVEFVKDGGGNVGFGSIKIEDVE